MKEVILAKLTPQENQSLTNLNIGLINLQALINLAGSMSRQYEAVRSQLVRELIEKYNIESQYIPSMSFRQETGELLSIIPDIAPEGDEQPIAE